MSAQRNTHKQALLSAVVTIALGTALWSCRGGTALSRAPLATKAVNQPDNIEAMNIAAPELTGTSWLNIASSRPPKLVSRRGKVTLVEFWTFACSNCQANLGAYSRLQTAFASRGVEIIGIHTAETALESNPTNVARKVKELGITYPVLLDVNMANWNRWGNRYWPSIYLVDKAGHIRYRWIGELNSNGNGGESTVSRLLEKLLAEPSSFNGNQQGIKMSDKIVKADAEWKRELSPQAYDVLRQHGTEAAFSGAYWNNHEAGTYVCAACDLPLFSSDTKFESGTGWPSFWQPLTPTSVTNFTDNSYGMTRTEIVCSRCGSHLGHVFDDGPKPTGLRYCMNSVALKFEKR